MDIRYLLIALLLAIVAPAQAQESTTHFNAGQQASSRRDYATAAKEFAEAARLYGLDGDHFQEFQALMKLGAVYEKLNNPAGSEVAYANALKLAKKMRNKAFEAEAANGLGEVAFNAGNWTAAITQLRKALKAAKAANDPDLERSILISIGAAQNNSGQKAKGLKSYQQALKLAEKSRNSLGQIDAHFRIAKLISGKKPKEALDHYIAAEQIAVKSGDRANQKAALHNQSLIYDVLGQPAKAAEARQKSATL